MTIFIGCPCLRFSFSRYVFWVLVFSDSTVSANIAICPKFNFHFSISKWIPGNRATHLLIVYYARLLFATGFWILWDFVCCWPSIVCNQKKRTFPNSRIVRFLSSISSIKFDFHPPPLPSHPTTPTTTKKTHNLTAPPKYWSCACDYLERNRLFLVLVYLSSIDPKALTEKSWPVFPASVSHFSQHKIVRFILVCTSGQLFCFQTGFHTRSVFAD